MTDIDVIMDAVKKHKDYPIIGAMAGSYVTDLAIFHYHGRNPIEQQMAAAKEMRTKGFDLDKETLDLVMYKVAKEIFEGRK